MSETIFPETNWATKGGFVNVKPVGAVPITAAQVADRMGIADAFNRYAIGWDEGCIDVVASCFTDDVSFSGSTGGVKQGVTVEGIDGLRERIESRWAEAIPDNYGQRRHCVTNICIEHLTDTEASALAYCVVPIAVNGLYLKSALIYSGDLRKCDDGFWRFSRFFIGMDDYAEGAPKS